MVEVRCFGPILELCNRTLSTMNHESVQQPSSAAPTVICSGALRERDPRKFNGTDGNDAEDWLSMFERVSNHNRWDDKNKLINVPFSLTGLAETWCNNNESRNKTWSSFRCNFMEVFGRPSLRKLQAEQRLRVRGQQSGETFTSYIEDVIDLCKRVDPSMAETEKVRHILKGVDDDAFQMLLSKDPRTVVDVARLCQSFDELRKQRALARQACAREQPVSSVEAVYEGDPAQFARIKDFIREEVARQVSLLPYISDPPSTLAPSLQNVIKEEVPEALQSAQHNLPVAAPLTYASVAGRLSHQPASFSRRPVVCPPAASFPAASFPSAPRAPASLPARPPISPMSSP